MPMLACHPCRVLVSFDHINLGVSGDLGRCRGMPVQVAEPATELCVLLHAQLLIVEEDHQMLEERVMHLVELLVIERFGEIDTKDLCADAGRQLAYFYGLVTRPYPCSRPCRRCN